MTEEWTGKHSLKIDNLKVWKIMKSLSSKGLATETYNWGYYYYVITEKGIAWIKDQLGFTDERLKPATLMAASKDMKNAAPARAEGGRPARGGRIGTRGGKAEGAQEAAPAEANAPVAAEPQAE